MFTPRQSFQKIWCANIFGVTYVDSTMGVLEDPGNLTNGLPESHLGQGGVKFIVRISENYNLCHANLNTTIKSLCFIIFHSSLIL